MIKWKVNTYDDMPEKLDVISETACFVTINAGGYTRRIRRDGVYDTFEAAKSAMIEHLKLRIESAEHNLNVLNGRLNRIKTIEVPDDKI